MTKIHNPLRCRILLVDDEDFIRRVVGQVLTSLGYAQITEESDGRRAVERLRAIKYDLIVTDVQMPQLNGLELLKRIRCGETGAPPDSRVVMVTSFANTDVLGVAMALDVNGFLVKPMTPANVEARVRTALDERFEAREAAHYAAVETRAQGIDEGGGEGADGAARANARLLKPVGAAQADIVDEGRFTSQAAPWLNVPKNARRFSALQLRPGMVLCEELRLTDGTLVLSARNRLSETTVNRLSDLRALLPSEMLWVQVPESDQ